MTTVFLLLLHVFPGQEECPTLHNPAALQPHEIVTIFHVPSLHVRVDISCGDLVQAIEHSSLHVTLETHWSELVMWPYSTLRGLKSTKIPEAQKFLYLTGNI